MSNLMRLNPFNELVDDLFKGLPLRAMLGEGQDAPPRMRVDVSEKNGAYLVSAELPGVKKEDIQIAIDGAQVTLAAEVKHEKSVAPEARLLHAERAYGKMKRSFSLPQALDETRAEARFCDGVLELTLPKKEAPQRKQITIQ